MTESAPGAWMKAPPPSKPALFLEICAPSMTMLKRSGKGKLGPADATHRGRA